MALREVIGHKAKSQAKVIEDIIFEFQSRQKELNLTPTKLNDFGMIVFDNTNSNTGERGVRGEFDLLRKEEWKKSGSNGEFKPLFAKGCEDHICNLISKEIEKRINVLMTNWNFKKMISNGGRNAATYVVIHLTKRLIGSPFRRGFRYFVHMNGGKTFKFERVSETRFSSVDILSLTFYK